MASSLVDIQWGPEGSERTPLQIITKMHVSQDLLRDNVCVNIKRNLPRFMNLPGILHARKEPIAICGGGPSLDRFADKIKTFKQIMVCGSAHDHVVRLGITPTFAIAVDGIEDAADYFKKPQENTSYLLASQCHPNLFERLSGHKIAMWNFKGQLDDEEKYFNGEETINWGCMVGVHSIQMALYLGFQELHFFGMDCSYIEDNHHAYDVGDYHAQLEANKNVFRVNDKDFNSTTALVSQAEHFFDVFASSDGQYLKGYVYGDGLLANIIKASPPEMKEWLEAA